MLPAEGLLEPMLPGLKPEDVPAVLAVPVVQAELVQGEQGTGGVRAECRCQAAVVEAAWLEPFLPVGYFMRPAIVHDIFHAQPSFFATRAESSEVFAKSKSKSYAGKSSRSVVKATSHRLQRGAGGSCLQAYCC